MVKSQTEDALEVSEEDCDHTWENTTIEFHILWWTAAWAVTPPSSCSSADILRFLFKPKK